jgi:hypothetical protein
MHPELQGIVPRFIDEDPKGANTTPNALHPCICVYEYTTKKVYAKEASV